MSELLEAQVIQLYQNKITIRDIQKELSISSGKVYKILDDNNIDRKGGYKPINFVESKKCYIGKHISNFTILDVVLKDDIRKSQKYRVSVRCDCGTVKEINFYDLVNFNLVFENSPTSKVVG
jgi:hypothetical protein